MIWDLNAISGAIIGSAIEVHKKLGPGLLESTYLKCLCHEMLKTGLQFKTELPMPLIYEDVYLDAGYRLDMLVEDRVVVELKSLEALLDVHTAQVLTYLKLSGAELGLLINFNVPKLVNGIKRFKPPA